MKRILKIVLWVILILAIGYLLFGRTKKEVVAPTPEMTGGAGGERAQMGENEDLEIGVSGEMSI